MQPRAQALHDEPESENSVEEVKSHIWNSEPMKYIKKESIAKPNCNHARCTKIWRRWIGSTITTHTKTRRWGDESAAVMNKESAIDQNMNTPKNQNQITNKIVAQTATNRSGGRQEPCWKMWTLMLARTRNDMVVDPTRDKNYQSVEEICWESENVKQK